MYIYIYVGGGVTYVINMILIFKRVNNVFSANVTVQSFTGANH
jgi:hypothetical protein